MTLNDPQFVEAARHLAQTGAASEGGDEPGDAARFHGAPTAGPAVPEPRRCRSFRRALNELLAFYQAAAGRCPEVDRGGRIEGRCRRWIPPTLAAWTMLANELMNLDEVLNK